MFFFLKLFNNYHGVNVDTTFGLQKKKKKKCEMAENGGDITHCSYFFSTSLTVSFCTDKHKCKHNEKYILGVSTKQDSL